MKRNSNSSSKISSKSFSNAAERRKFNKADELSASLADLSPEEKQKVVKLAENVSVYFIY